MGGQPEGMTLPALMEPFPVAIDGTKLDANGSKMRPARYDWAKEFTPSPAATFADRRRSSDRYSSPKLPFSVRALFLFAQGITDGD